jgi:hypothetical protein
MKLDRRNDPGEKAEKRAFPIGRIRGMGEQNVNANRAEIGCFQPALTPLSMAVLHLGAVLR